MLTCEHTSLRIPECSCFHCTRAMIAAVREAAAKPSTFPGKQPPHIEGQTEFPSETPANLRNWQVIWRDRMGHVQSRTVPAQNDEIAERRLAEDEQIPVTNVLDVTEIQGD